MKLDSAISLILIGLLVACSSKKSNFEGDWLVNNNQYTARYKVFKEPNGMLSAMVMYLNDGTTIYTHRDSNLYLFKNQKESENKIGDVDGVSGATSTRNNQKQVYNLTSIAEDTLELSYKIHGKKLKEYWTRIKTGNNE